jgi:hypothetical protein
VQHKTAFQPRVSLPEVGLVVSRWTAAKAGAIASLWPAAPRGVSRYLEEMLAAHAHSLSRKTHPT